MRRRHRAGSNAKERGLKYAEVIAKIEIPLLARIVLWCIAGAFLSIRSYVDFRNPSPDRSWLTPYSLMLMASLAFFAAFDAFRKRDLPAEPEAQPEPLTSGERIGFRLLGAFVLLVGTAGLSIGCWLAWDQWSRVAQWPRVDAILVRKEISTVGARLIFQYDAEGRRFTGLAFRWGSENAVRAALEGYEPGTVHRISYDPHDTSQVETILTYNWELFKAPVILIVLGLLLIFGGVTVYPWSITGRSSNVVLHPGGH